MASERLVLDASYVIEAILPTSKGWQIEAFDMMDRIAERDVDARVPWIFFAEVAALVTRKVRARRLAADDGREFLERVDALAMHVDLTLEQSAALHGAAMHWNCGAYDAVYVDVASRMAVPLATRDRGMAAAARMAGVQVF